MNKLRLFLKSRKNIKKDVLLFNDYIERGLYHSISDKKTFKKAKWLSLFNPKKFKYLYSFDGKGNVTAFTIKKGTEKLNFITNSFVVSKPFNMLIPINEIEKRTNFYLPKLKFPHNSYIWFSKEKNEIVSNFVQGDFFNDALHNSKLLDTLCSCSEESDTICIQNIVFYVQHGDATGGNLIWQNNDAFLAIDNEQVGLYPAFYDIFHLISITVETPKDFISQCGKTRKFFERFCRKWNLAFNSDLIDSYVSYFVYFRMRSYPKDRIKNAHRPFKFLSQGTSVDLFPKSTKILNDFYNDIENKTLENVFREALSYHEK